MSDYNDIFSSFLEGNLQPFYSRMYPGMLRFTAGMLGDELAYMAEDCVQDVVLAAYIRRATFSGERYWRSWMLVSIRNRAIQLLRKVKTSQGYLTYLEGQDFDTNGVETALIEQETMDIFFAAIEALPVRYREIVELSFEQGLKNEEVAGLLGITEVAVRKRKLRLIELLREKLGGKLDMGAIVLLLSYYSELTRRVAE